MLSCVRCNTKEAGDEDDIALKAQRKRSWASLSIPRPFGRRGPKPAKTSGATEEVPAAPAEEPLETVAVPRPSSTTSSSEDEEWFSMEVPGEQDLDVEQKVAGLASKAKHSQVSQPSESQLFDIQSLSTADTPSGLQPTATNALGSFPRSLSFTKSGVSIFKTPGMSTFLERHASFARKLKEGEHCWLPFDPATFNVRSATYLKDSKKAPSRPCLLETVNLDFFLIGKDGPIPHAATHHDLCPAHCRRAGDKRFLFIQNWILPPYQAVLTAAVPAQADWLQSDTPYARTWNRFVNADNAHRREAFKLIMGVEKGPWLVRSVVPKKPVIIGRPLKMESYHEPGQHLEIVIDVSSGRVEQVATSITMMALRNIQIAQAVLIESKREDELPEALLMCNKINHLDTSKVMLPVP